MEAPLLTQRQMIEVVRRHQKVRELSGRRAELFTAQTTLAQARKNSQRAPTEVQIIRIMIELDGDEAVFGLSFTLDDIQARAVSEIAELDRALAELVLPEDAA